MTRSMINLSYNKNTMKKLLLTLLFSSPFMVWAQCPSSVSTSCVRQANKTISIPRLFLPPLEIPGGTYLYSFTVPGGEGLDCTNLPTNIALNAIIPPFVIPIDFDFEREDPCDDSDGITYSEIICLPDLGANLCTPGTPPFVVDLGSVTCVYSTSGVLLPVEFVFFDIQVEEEGVNLIWETATESNNQGFEIQRSQDGKIWEALDFQLGAGSTTEPQRYSYLDKNALPGINYYRLKQIDYTGAFEYSKVVIAQIKDKYDDPLAFPNPAKDFVYLSLGKKSAFASQKIRIKMFDALGGLVKSLELTTVHEEIFEIPLSGLAVGAYTIEIDDDLERQYLRIIKNAD